MLFGVMMFTTDYSISPVDLALAAEERGFESLWFPEHSHIPLSRLSRWAGKGDLPRMYYDVLDPFVGLAAAAAVTQTIKIGTGICLVIQRDPIQTAKEVATLDYISNGRVLFGVGAGWNAEEMADHGTAFKSRFRLMEERVEAMKTIWTQDTPEYHGEFVNFDAMETGPRPVQNPYPPIIIGGGFPHGARRAIAYGDGWMPGLSAGVDVVSILPQFRQMVAEAGKNPDTMPVTNFGFYEDLDYAAPMADAGVARAVFALPAEKADTVLPLMDKYAAVARRHA